MLTRLDVAVQAARSAGALLLEHRERGVEVERKGRVDVVSAADREAEGLIREALARSFPDDQVVGEEGTSVPEAEVQGIDRWYVDPLDGTINFLQGLPHFGVSLAWCSAQDSVGLGVVYVPATDELYTATRGAGAHLNGSSIAVTSVDRLEDAVIATGFPYEFDGHTNFAEWERVARRARGVRCLGAAAVDLCEVARGRLDGFWEVGLQRWDSAAGVLIATEAGAVVTDPQGRVSAAAQEDVVVAGPDLHDVLLATVSLGNVKAT